MKIFKNVLLSALIGHAFGVTCSLICAFFALKMPNSDASASIFGLLSSTVGALAMAIASKKQSSGSVLCATLSAALYLAIGFAVGSVWFAEDAFGWKEVLILAESFAFALALCFSGVTFMGKRRTRRRIRQKIYK